MAYSIADNVRNIPPVTRFFTISSILCCFVIALGRGSGVFVLNNSIIFAFLANLRIAIHSHKLTYIVAAVAQTIFQCYRFLTTFLTPSGMFTDSPYLALLDIYGFYTFACDLESSLGKFKGNFPDCLWFTLITGTMIVISTFTFELFYPAHHSFHHLMMLSCVTYLWSRYLKNATINFMGLVPIKGYFLPLFNLFLKLLFEGGGAVVNSIIGILGGYLYQCIQSDTLPLYNLLPGAYSKFVTGNRGGHRVGMSEQAHIQSTGGYQSDYIEDSVYDKGYLKAPLSLYKLLKYPSNNTKSWTAFTGPKNPSSIAVPATTGSRSSGMFSSDGPAFRGKGYRLGD